MKVTLLLKGFIAFVIAALITKWWEVAKAMEKRYWSTQLRKLTVETKPSLRRKVLQKTNQQLRRYNVVYSRYLLWFKFLSFLTKKSSEGFYNRSQVKRLGKTIVQEIFFSCNLEVWLYFLKIMWKILLGPSFWKIFLLSFKLWKSR